MSAAFDKDNKIGVDVENLQRAQKSLFDGILTSICKCEYGAALIAIANAEPLVSESAKSQLQVLRGITERLMWFEQPRQAGAGEASQVDDIVSIVRKATIVQQEPLSQKLNMYFGTDRAELIDYESRVSKGIALLTRYLTQAQFIENTMHLQFLQLFLAYLEFLQLRRDHLKLKTRTGYELKLTFLYCSIFLIGCALAYLLLYV